MDHGPAELSESAGQDERQKMQRVNPEGALRLHELSLRQNADPHLVLLIGDSDGPRANNEL